ncbi:TPA: hypothetical protein GDO54_018465 [Pyxicephalus adspersus]|uniref:Uncharacterized protein n=1 Tax=Pyxicephalus adspersus TaxID=30357 RepID=A0AAV2ZJL1_PYXAD|nr:TPA: hypothetical protein GDO54_018465 [Pyxicephalus adspersus]
MKTAACLCCRPILAGCTGLARFALRSSHPQQKNRPKAICRSRDVSRCRSLATRPWACSLLVRFRKEGVKHEGYKNIGNFKCQAQAAYICGSSYPSAIRSHERCSVQPRIFEAGWLEIIGRRQPLTLQDPPQKIRGVTEKC